MKQEIADKWIAALRSGDYQQGRKALLASGSFCCLGVLCELHRQEAGGEWAPTRYEFGLPNDASEYHAPNGDWDDSILPDAVREWAGLQSGSPAAQGRKLTKCNDSGWTFSQLADLIGNHWETL